MRNRILPFLAISALIIAMIGLFAAKNPDETTTERPTVAATIFPIADITRNIAGDDVDVVLLLPPGASPHTFEPSPSTLRAIVAAQAVYAIGHGLDSWAGPLANDNGTPVVLMDNGIALRRFDHDAIHEDEGEHEEHEGEEDHDHADTHDHAGIDPHYWLDMRNAETIAATIAADLSARFPDHADAFAERLKAYALRLQEADAEIRGILADARGTPMVTLHDAWYYFGDAYGLDIVGTFVPAPGREPTPRYLADLGRAVKEHGITTLYTEPQISTSTLQPFIEDNGLAVATLQAEGDITDDNGSYIDLMRDNARIIAAHQH